MKLVTNKDYKGQGVRVLIKGKEYPLIRTTTKMACYQDGDKERKTKLDNIKIVHSKQKDDKKKKDKIQFFGGFMPHVPDSCDHHRIFYDDRGIRWLDNTICAKCKNKCKRKKEFDNIKTYNGLWEDLYSKLTS